MDKLEQIKETIEESAGLLDKQPEYYFKFDEIIRIIQENGYDRIKYYEDWPCTTYLSPRWNLEIDDGYYWDRQYRTAVSPIWTDTRIRTNTQATINISDAVVATPRHPEEWCDFITNDHITF